MSTFVRILYSIFFSVGAALQPMILLALRLYWGWGFFVTGRDKLLNITPVIEFFTSLEIPFPTLNAYMAGITESVCGLCLIFGFASRLVSVPLIVVMSVAYYTAHHDALINIFADPKAFVSQSPFNFLLTSLIVFAFGPGLFSIDAILKRYFFREEPKI